MIRNLKGLGLALVAVLAMSAVGAAGAQGSHFAWESGATAFEAEADPNEPSQLFTTTASNLTCNEVSAGVTLPGGTTAEALETSNLKYDNNKTGKCVGTGGLEPKFEMNGCDLVFHAGATVAGGIEATADIVCPPNQTIVINAGFLCEVHFGTQSGLTGIKFTNVKTGTKEEVTLEATVENIKETHKGLCGNGSAENGIYHGKWTIDARNGSGAQLHTTVT